MFHNVYSYACVCCAFLAIMSPVRLKNSVVSVLDRLHTHPWTLHSEICRNMLNFISGDGLQMPFFCRLPCHFVGAVDVRDRFSDACRSVC